MSEMREILYRGLLRRKDEKVRPDGTPVESKWVYGGVCQFKGERSIIYQIEPEIAKFPVYAETVGEYTGLTDKNGVKIFEGDIVEYPDKARISNVSAGEVYFDARFAEFRVFLPESCGIGVSKSLADIIDEAVIIGNIHDNPELLKGEEK